MLRKEMTRKLSLAVFGALLIGGLVLSGCATQNKENPAQSKTPKNRDVILATTTSTVDTGLLDVLIPKFEEQTGYKIKTIPAGSGQALAMGEKGEADVLLVHSPRKELPLAQSGVAINRRLVMHNDFVIVGPPDDPAGIKGLKSSVEAFKKIAEKKALFISRGDNSGTHTKELDIWKQAGITPEGAWYQQSGQGMGQTLLMASEKKAYTLSDRGTYLAQKKNINLNILVEGDRSLLNIYHVMQVNPKKFPKVNAEGARAFVDFMVSSETQKFIAEFGKDKYGQNLFVPDAGKNEDELGT